MNEDEGEPANDPCLAREGDVIAQKYLIERVIGEGGMAFVFVAQHMQLDRRVALKILKPSFLSSPEVLTRFLREARAVSHLSSEHVARVLDVGTLDQGSPFLVMEYLQGADLGMVLSERGKLPLGEAVDLIMQAIDAIAEAHSQGIVHRDLKPENLFLTSRPDGTPLVKVLDFGIALSGARPGRAEHGLTQATTTFGSPSYMSPEQIRSAHNVDARGDIWALGVILYELVSGRQPFGGTTPAETCAMVLRDEAAPLGVTCPELPADFVAVVHRCLAKNRANRLPNVAALAKAIAPYGGKSARLYASRIRIVLEGGVPALPPPASAQQSESIVPASISPPDFIHQEPDGLSDPSLPTSTTLYAGQRPSAPWRRWAGPIVAAAFGLTALGGVGLYRVTHRAIAVAPAVVPMASASLAASIEVRVPVVASVLPPVEAASPTPAHVVVPAPAVHAERTASAMPIPPPVATVPPVADTDLYGNRK